MSYPQVQFVAAPEDGAEVLFDFNNDLAAAIEDGTFSLGTPEVLGDPDGLGIQYGARTIEFDLLIHGTRGAAMAAQAALARTFMLRRRGWLRIRLDDLSTPVWARTYTPTPGELDFSMVLLESNADTWRISVEVAAEPFIRGERITFPAVTIANDPAAAANPMSYLLPPIVGDAPAPLRIAANFSENPSQQDILWSTAAVPAASAPIVWQIGTGDVWGGGLGGDTSEPIADAAYSGGSYREVTFAVGPEMRTRIAGNAPTVLLPGRYKVMLRVARSGLAGSYAFRLGYRSPFGDDMVAGSRTAVMDRGNNTTAPHATWVDLGDFDFPTPSAAIDMPGSSAAPKIVLQVQRVTGGGHARLDCFVLIPLDVAAVSTLESWEKADVLVSEFAGAGPRAAVGDLSVWDGDTESVVRKDTAGVLDATVKPSNRGSFLNVRPGVENRLSLIQQTRLSDGAFGVLDNHDVITRSATLEVSYQPRWLWLGDA